MSKTRTYRREAQRNYLKRAMELCKSCPVCGMKMKGVWYSRSVRKCTHCKTKVGGKLLKIVSKEA